MKTKAEYVIIFDLDDTLYKEIEYLNSAYKAIAQYLSEKTNISAQTIFENMLVAYGKGTNVFESIINSTQVSSVTINELIRIYRHHAPNITLPISHRKLLNFLKSKNIPMGLITDGRSVQQRHKIEALGLYEYFEIIVISEEFGTEKPNLKNFEHVENQFGHDFQYIYVGDNTFKDFKGPNTLGWISVCLIDDGRNIHKQSDNVALINSPQYKISELAECLNILNL